MARRGGFMSEWEGLVWVVCGDDCWSLWGDEL